MNNNEKRVSRARKFVAGLALVMAMSGLSGCSFKNGNNNDNNQSIENTIESEQDITSEVVVPEIETEDNKETNEEENQDNHEENQEIDPSTTIVDEEPTIVPNHEHETEIDLEIPNIGDYNGYSIVEALMAVGYPSDYNTRKELATILGIENYRGTAEQNLELIRLLKEYADSLVVNPPVEENPIEEEVHTHQYVLNPIIYTITNCGDAGHMITYQFECSCGDKYNKNSDIENHNLHTETTHEDENSDGYYLVTTAVCSDCSYRKEVSRTYVDIRDDEDEEECEHNNTHEVKRAVNISEEGHDINVYRVCNECGHKDFVRTYHVTHEFVEQAPVRENVNGCTYESVVYKTCYCADCNTTFRIEVSRTPMGSHKYEEKETVTSINDTQHKITTYKECTVCHGKIDEVSSIENHDLLEREVHKDVTDDGYWLVVEKYCTGCDYSKELSRTYVSTKECEHTYHTETRIINETEDSHVEVTYNVCDKCPHEEEVSRKTVDHVYVQEENVTIENENPDNCSHEEVYYETCTCGEHVYRRPIEKTRKIVYNHTYGDGTITYNYLENNPEHHSTITTYTCSVCGKKKTEESNEAIPCTYGKEINYYQKDDGVWYESQKCEHCDHVNEIIHSCDESKYEYVEGSATSTQHTVKCPHCNKTSTINHTWNHEDYLLVDGKLSRECTACGYEDIVECEHEFDTKYEHDDNGNCFKILYCKTCGFETSKESYEHSSNTVYNAPEGGNSKYDGWTSTTTYSCGKEEEPKTHIHDIPDDAIVEPNRDGTYWIYFRCKTCHNQIDDNIDRNPLNSSTQNTLSVDTQAEVETEEKIIEEETVTQVETVVEEETVTETETKTETETVTEEVEEEKMEEISEETEEKTEEEQQTEEKEEATPEDSKPEESQEEQIVAYVEYPYGYNSNRRESAKTLTYTFRV